MWYRYGYYSRLVIEIVNQNFCNNKCNFYQTPYILQSCKSNELHESLNQNKNIYYRKISKAANRKVQSFRTDWNFLSLYANSAMWTNIQHTQTLNILLHTYSHYKCHTIDSQPYGVEYKKVFPPWKK